MVIQVFTFKNVKYMESQHCLWHHTFALKLVCQNIIEIDLDPPPITYSVFALICELMVVVEY